MVLKKREFFANTIELPLHCILVGKTVSPSWEKIKKESGPYVEKLRVGAAPVLDQVSTAAGAARVQLVDVAEAVLRHIHLNSLEPISTQSLEVTNTNVRQ